MSTIESIAPTATLAERSTARGYRTRVKYRTRFAIYESAARGPPSGHPGCRFVDGEPGSVFHAAQALTCPVPPCEMHPSEAQPDPSPADERLVRLNKVLADRGIASRRRCDELIARGKVSVDGQPVTELGTKIDPAVQTVEVDGVVLRPEPARRRYYLLNKPRGVVCTNEPRELRPRAIDLIRDPEKGRIFTVGRLDEDSEGLILLTNDGEFANRIAHPSHGVTKTYLVKVRGRIDTPALERMRAGVRLAEGRTGGARVRMIKRTSSFSTLAVTLEEGKNREVRRIFAKVGFNVIALRRTHIGHLSDRRLKPRQWRPLLRRDAKFLVFLPLAARNANGELEGRLAERWEHSPDYRDWTVHLRRDVRWHDGVPVTAHDVKFTMDLLTHPAVLKVPPDAFSLTVLDDSTYRITCQKEANGSPLDDWTVYYPKHLLEKLDPRDFYQWDFWTRPVGNGPYRYLRRLPKTMMEFEANPDYYRGRPRIERVVLKFGELSMTEILSGNVDVLPYVPSMDLLKVKGDPRFRVYTYLGPGESALRIPKAILWNLRHPPFRDARVRRALTLAINRRELHEALNLPEGMPIFDVLYTPGQFRRGEIPDPLPYDPEQAKRLLEEAGWHDTDGDGLREREGKPFRFTLRTTAAEGGDKPAVYIQAQLRRVGIQVDLQLLDAEAHDQRVRDGDFEAAIFR
ncbi:MAG TPA: pseudouridine synthase, partial [Planctomycetota bacterium]|nr:pseudouridine synthase [Planctomycetota bacterium]